MDYNLPNYEQRLHEYTSYHTLEPCTTGLTLTVGPLPDGPFRDPHLGSQTVRPYAPSTTLKMFGARFSFGFGSDILNAALWSVLGSRWGPSGREGARPGTMGPNAWGVLGGMGWYGRCGVALKG